MTPELIISTLSFVLNSILLSSFIIPQVQKLKEIKDQLFKFKLTHVPTSGEMNEIRTKEALREDDARNLQTILDTYRVRSEELKPIVKQFWVSVLVALLALLLMTLLPNVKEIVLSIHPILQLLILLWAIKTYATDPDQLSSPAYLVKHCEINPHLLIGAMGLQVSLDAGKGLFAKLEPSDPLSINLSMKLRLRGFRFIYILADNNSKVYFVSFGPITPETPLWRHYLYPVLGISEVNRIVIGKVRLNMIQNRQELKSWFLVFLPIFKHETVNPMCAWTGFHISEANAGDMVSGLSGGMGSINTDTVYKGISYKGEGICIDDLQISDDPNKSEPIINKVIAKYRNDLMRTKSIKQFEGINGQLI